MKILIPLILVLCLSTVCFGATFSIPFRCWEEELIREFKKYGINLDKNDINADGFIENNASSYKIHTYKRPDNLDAFIKAPRKVAIKMGKYGNRN